MRTMLHAAFLAGLLIPAAGVTAPAAAADLDYIYAPRPVPVLPPPPPPCGVYRPCLLPPRFGYLPPRPYRYSYVERDYYAPRREGYGYDYDRERYEMAHRHFERYGYQHPNVDPYTAHLYERRERTERSEHVERGERYEGGRPFADPLGQAGRRGDERFGERDGYERGPGFRGERDPYDHG